MLKIDEVKIPVNSGENAIIKAAAKRLRTDTENIAKLKILRRSLDARKKHDLHYVYSLEVEVKTEERKLLSRLKDKHIAAYSPMLYTPPQNNYTGKYRPIVVGAGPAGIFSGLILAEAGLAPLIIEQGKAVEERSRDVINFWQRRSLNRESNVQFGEGGAGTFSDGKLNTGTKDIRHRRILEDFISAGAPEEIGYLAKPHIGSDNLPLVVSNLRRRIEKAGGEYRFSTRLRDIIVEKGAVVGVKLQSSKGEETLNCDRLVLATGHSARDLYALLYRKGVVLAPKAFSMGVRIEHPQKIVNAWQYGTDALGAADYKLAVHVENGRGVYTFCMCPGGVVIGAASEPKSIVTNGMSVFARNGANANSALLVSVKPEDFPTSHPLGGMYWQQEVEKAGFFHGGEDYSAPCQRLEDFLAHRPSTHLGTVKPTYLPGVRLGQIDTCLPPLIIQGLRAALPLLNKKLPGFTYDDALLTGPETRSSAPVRIIRNDQGEANIKGIFPTGEGSGYAGGIMSAAADGIRTAEFLLNHLY
ncbi:MAG: hypothetical protein Q4C00_02545 [Bacillota bacterium]|nr:hypothetical protein [Bacillota bacterium]